MVPRIVLLCAGLVILPQAAFSQDSPVTQADMQSLREELKAEMEEIRAAIESLQPRTDDTVRPVGVENNQQLEQRIRALEDAQLEMRFVQHDQGVVLGQIAMRGETGDHHVRFDTNSHSARREIQRAVRTTVPRRGDFIIRNLTGRDQDIIVNGHQFRVFADAELPLQVPPGTVTSRVPGQGTRTWHVGLPDYRQVIELRERQSPNTIRWVTNVPIGEGAIGWTAAY